MDCLYQNIFCSQFCGTTKIQLCNHCNIRYYMRNQRLSGNYWNEDLAICLDGLMIFGNHDLEKNRILTNGIATAGSIINVGNYYDIKRKEIEQRSILCVIDCIVAVFDSEFISRLFNENIEFVKTVYRYSLRSCIYEKIEMMNAIGNGTAYDAVRYVCRFCKKYNIDSLTHEQIALICNRSRPTVTEIMHQLTKNEPELFVR